MSEYSQPELPDQLEFEWTTEHYDFDRNIGKLFEEVELLAKTKKYVERQSRKLSEGERSIPAPKGHLFRISGPLILEREERYSIYGEKGWVWRKLETEENISEFFASSIELEKDADGDLYYYASIQVEGGRYGKDNFRVKLGSKSRISTVKILQDQSVS